MYNMYLFLLKEYAFDIINKYKILYIRPYFMIDNSIEEKRMKEMRWNISGYDRELAVKNVRNGQNPLVAVILASRGIHEKDSINRLLADDIGFINDPMLMKDMDKAVYRIREAIEKNEHVAVYGDYDVDGITSSCLMASYLRSKGLRCEIYIPNRLEDGYGMKDRGLLKLHELGATLVISVDCGITAAEEAEYAKKIGIDVIITDHHECGERLPEAVAVINPKRRDCEYPEKALAGVGVAFKLICAVEGEDSLEKMLQKYGDLLAVGTIADVMPVIGENRIFIKRGIKELRKSGRPGIRKLCETGGLEGKPISMTNIGYTLAPRLNAAGRLGYTDEAVKLLLTEDMDEAEALALRMCELNRERQALESEMFEQCIKMLDKRAVSDKPIILAKEGWHQGVAGIVASRLAERFRVPTIVICLSDGIGRGSCRSYGSFNIFGALESMKDMFETFGGHEMAAGLTITEQNIKRLEKRLEELYCAAEASEREAVLNIDIEVVKPGLMTLDNVASISSLEPYGNGNPQPVMCIMGASVELVSQISNGKHTKLWISKNGETFECVFFSHTAEELGIKEGDVVDAAFSPQINEYRGKRNIQLLLSDIKKSEK